jgi:hypothetical protein
MAGQPLVVMMIPQSGLRAVLDRGILDIPALLHIHVDMHFVQG